MTEVFLPETIERHSTGRLTTNELKERFNWIFNFMYLNGFAPSYQEMSDGWHVTRAAIRNSLEGMQRREWLTFIPGVSRSIRLLRDRHEIKP